MLGAILYFRKVKGSFIISMLIVYIIGMIVGVAKLPTGIVSLPPSVKPVLFNFDFANMNILKILPVILFVIMFAIS